MKIAVNTRLLQKDKLEGIGWFTHEIFSRLTKQHPEIEWHFFFDRAWDPAFQYTPQVRMHRLGPPSRHPLLWYLWFEYSVPYLLKKHQIDLFISPDGYLPLSSSCPSISVIHDINFEHQKRNLDPVAGAYMRYFFPRFARRADRLATVSEYSAHDLVKTYGVDPQKIDLIYNGVADFFQAISAEEKKAVRKQWSKGQDFFIFIGALNPRKNIDGMMQAYQLYRQAGGQSKFLMVGERMLWSKKLEALYQAHPYREDLIFTGRLQGSELNRVLAAAQALTFVSHFEGFGIPILEAFRAETPVITANNSSMPEVAGDAALYCAANDHQAIAFAMQEVERPNLRAELTRKGKERALLFSWDRSAEMMWDSIQKISD